MDVLFTLAAVIAVGIVTAGAVCAAVLALCAAENARSQGPSR